MGHNECPMFCQITADEERRVSRRIVVVQYASLVFPQFRPLAAHSIPPTRWNFLAQLFVCHLTTWYKFMMDNAFPINKHKQQHLDLWATHLCFFFFFFGGGDLFDPLWRLRLGLNIMPINPRLISSHDVRNKVFITICIGKQFLTDFNTVLFLIVSQLTRNEFCTDAKHLKFFQ